MNQEEWLGHISLVKASQIVNGEDRLRFMLTAHPSSRPLLVRVDGRPGEMLEGFEAWQAAAAGVVAIRFYDTGEVEYFLPEQWVAARRELITK